jgi:putative ABC transport system substrate-binding protein
MRRRKFIALLGGAAAWPLAARAQAQRTPRVGVLMGLVESDVTDQSHLTAFRDALAKLGWTEGRNIRIEVRWGGGDPALYARGAAELVALNAEVLVSEGTSATEALQRKTRTIPIVFIAAADPMGQGFVASLARPGGNITGFSALAEASMAGKWLEMLTQITPPAARVAMLFNPATAPYAGSIIPFIEEAARSLKVAVQAAPVNNDSDIAAVMTALAREEHGGLIVLASAFMIGHRDLIIGLAARHRLPAVYSFPLFAVDGGLMAYGVEIVDLVRRSAAYVDRILKGDNPGDLPVQQPTAFNLAINLKTAKAIGVTVAPSLVATADEVIE